MSTKFPFWRYTMHPRISEILRKMLGKVLV